MSNYRFMLYPFLFRATVYGGHAPLNTGIGAFLEMVGIGFVDAFWKVLNC